MYCIDCGSKLQIQGQKFCGGCGSKQDTESNSGKSTTNESNNSDKRPMAEKWITHKTKVHKETGAPYNPKKKYLYGFAGLIGGNIVFALGFAWVKPQDPNSIMVLICWAVAVCWGVVGASNSYEEKFKIVSRVEHIVENSEK